MTTLATNIISKATSQFSNYDFSGYLKIYGKHLGISSKGIIELTGDTDAGQIKTASLTLSNNNFGVLNDKKFAYFYIRVFATKDFMLSFIVDEELSSIEFVRIKKVGLQTLRVPCSRVNRGTSWSIKLDVLNSGYLKLYLVKAIPTIMHAGLIA